MVKVIRTDYDMRQLVIRVAQRWARKEVETCFSFQYIRNFVSKKFRSGAGLHVVIMGSNTFLHYSAVPKMLWLIVYEVVLMRSSITQLF